MREKLKRMLKIQVFWFLPVIQVFIMILSTTQSDSEFDVRSDTGYEEVEYPAYLRRDIVFRQI